jgi:phosphate/sulfate permease
MNQIILIMYIINIIIAGVISLIFFAYFNYIFLGTIDKIKEFIIKKSSKIFKRKAINEKKRYSC